MWVVPFLGLGKNEENQLKATNKDVYLLFVFGSGCAMSDRFKLLLLPSGC